MNKYVELQSTLIATGTGKMKVFGNSMLPILQSGSFLTYEVRDKYNVGDIVFSRVRGRWIDAHKITKINSQNEYMIANNHGYENGWTKQVFAKVVKAEHNGKIIYTA